MAHTESAKKRHRQSLKRRAQNRAVKSDLRTTFKKLLKTVKAGDTAAAGELLKVAFSKLDKCAVRRYLHPNTAHRYKSRLSKRVGGMAATTK